MCDHADHDHTHDDNEETVIVIASTPTQQALRDGNQSIDSKDVVTVAVFSLIMAPDEVMNRELLASMAADFARFYGATLDRPVVVRMYDGEQEEPEVDSLRYVAVATHEGGRENPQVFAGYRADPDDLLIGPDVYEVSGDDMVRAGLVAYTRTLLDDLETYRGELEDDDDDDSDDDSDLGDSEVEMGSPVASADAVVPDVNNAPTILEFKTAGHVPVRRWVGEMANLQNIHRGGVIRVDVDRHENEVDGGSHI
jgi:hypothetical protein